jgi:hypothetical protein
MQVQRLGIRKHSMHRFQESKVRVADHAASTSDAISGEECVFHSGHVEK